jgi:hypothetical protein
MAIVFSSSIQKLMSKGSNNFLCYVPPRKGEIRKLFEKGHHDDGVVIEEFLVIKLVQLRNGMNSVLSLVGPIEVAISLVA